MVETTRIPKWEITIQLGSLLILPTWNLVQGIIDGRPFWLVLLTTLGTIATVLLIIWLWTMVRPRRTRPLSDVELMNRIDGWLRDAGFGRTNLTLVGFTHTIGVSWAGQTVYLMKSDSRSQFVIAGSRQATPQDVQTFLQMSDIAWSSLLYDIVLEASRFGAFLEYQQVDANGNRWLSKTVYDLLPIDQQLTESRLIDRVNFIRRADSLMTFVAGKAGTAIVLSQQSVPHIAPTQQG